MYLSVSQLELYVMQAMFLLLLLWDSCTVFCCLSCRVMVIFLKRYGYNTTLSRNSKRIDFIRIPRFITVGVCHLLCML